MRIGFSAFVLLAAVAACRREPDKLARTEPWPAPQASSSAQASPVVSRARYALEQGEVEVEISSRGERARGALRALTGEIDVDFVDPTKSSGRVETDLASLRILAATGGEVDEEGSRRAQRALGLASGELPESFRRAAFQVRSLEALRPGAWLVRGDIALHGIRAPDSVEVSVTPPDPAENGSDRLVIRSLRPLVISLSTHDIRQEFGKTPPTDRKAAKGADEAKVSFSLTFRRSR